MILLSSTYQMSTAFDAKAAAIDPDNRLLWRMNRRRLDAEEIRDTLLAVGGQLDRTMGGSLLKSGNREYVAGTASVNNTNYAELAAVGLPARDPERPLRPVPGLRLRRSQHRQRPARHRPRSPRRRSA